MRSPGLTADGSERAGRGGGGRVRGPAGGVPGGQAGHEVVVLEARDRVGGRVWSQELVPGDPRTVIERGGEFVLDGYDVMRSGAAARWAWSLADTTMSYYEREPRGGARPRTRTWPAAPRPWRRRRRGARRAPHWPRWWPAGRALPAALAAYMSRVEVTNGVDAGRLAAAAVATSPRVPPRPCWRVAGGNQRLAQGLARGCGDRCGCGARSRAIEQDHDGVRVLTDDGEVAGDAVIVAVPMAVLRTCRSRRRSRAAPAAWRRAGLAHNAKLHVPLTRPAAASAVQSVPDGSGPGPRPTARARSSRSLHAFGGTEAGLAALARSRRAGDLGVPGGRAAARAAGGCRPGPAHHLERRPVGR